MGDEHTTPDTTEARSLPARLRQWHTTYRPNIPLRLRGRSGLITAAYGLLVAGDIVGVAAAQADGGGGSVGSQLCGTAIASTINSVAPLAMAVVVIGGLILTYLLHAYSGFKKDPQQVKLIKDWRNRSGTTAVSAPLLGKLLEIIIGSTGMGLAGCIDIVPGI